MTVCSQCAHYRKRSDDPKHFDCAVHCMTFSRESFYTWDCKSFALAGWSIEWLESGLRWALQNDDSWELTSSDGGPLITDWHGLIANIGGTNHAIFAFYGTVATGTLPDCARALVKRVTR